jgi:hypothetical protein
MRPRSTPSGGFAFDFFDDPSLNNFDMMAFRAFLDTGEQGIFAGDGFMTSLIADSSTFTSFNNPAINNVGMVVFHGLWRQEKKAFSCLTE